MAIATDSLPLGNDDAGERTIFSGTVKERRRQGITSAIGKEPKLSETSTNGQVCAAFNWYRYEHDDSDAKKYTITYLQKTFKGGEVVAARMKELPDWEFGATGWMTRQLSLGNSLPKEYMARLTDRLATLNMKARTILKIDDAAPVEVRVAPARMFTSVAATIIAELDGIIDDLTKKNMPADIYKMMAEKQPSLPTITNIVDYYKPYLDELGQCTSRGGDEQVKEAYEKVGKSRVKLLTEFITAILQACEQLSTNKKRERKPRAKKVKTALQLTKKMKYKLSDDTYKIKSVQPTDIVGSLQLWVLNTKTRKLGVYHAEDTKPLSIKGTTIVGFNKTSSVQKKLRKPEAIISMVASGTKVQLRNVMSDIKAKSSPLNGRINSDTILVRSIK